MMPYVVLQPARNPTTLDVRSPGGLCVGCVRATQILTNLFADRGCLARRRNGGITFAGRHEIRREGSWLLQGERIGWVRKTSVALSRVQRVQESERKSVRVPKPSPLHRLVVGSGACDKNGESVVHPGARAYRHGCTSGPSSSDQTITKLWFPGLVAKSFGLHPESGCEVGRRYLR